MIRQSNSPQNRLSRRAKRAQVEAEVLRLVGEIGTVSAGRLSSIVATCIDVSVPTVLRMVRALAERGQLLASVDGRIIVYQLNPEREQAGDTPPSSDTDEVAAQGDWRVAGMGRWTAAVGVSLIIVGEACRPALPHAYLILAAAYDADGTPVYRISASAGDLYWPAQADQPVAQLTIPAAVGASLGLPALTVGRLFPPTSVEHRFSPAKRGMAARMARSNPLRLGSLIARYQQHHRLSDAQLAAKLAISTQALDNIMLCQRPAADEQEGEAWSRYVRFVADIDGVPFALLAAVLRDAMQIERAALLNGSTSSILSKLNASRECLTASRSGIKSRTVELTITPPQQLSYPTRLRQHLGLRPCRGARRGYRILPRHPLVLQSGQIAIVRVPCKTTGTAILRWRCQSCYVV